MKQSRKLKFLDLCFSFCFTIPCTSEQKIWHIFGVFVIYLVLLSVPFRIKGTTAVELASGLHWYIKYWCGAHISWDKTGGIQINSIPKPGSLPLVKDEGVVIQRPVPWNYYQNVVTSSCKHWIFHLVFTSRTLLLLFYSDGTWCEIWLLVLRTWTWLCVWKIV